MTQSDLDKLLDDIEYQDAQRIAYTLKGKNISYALKILDKAKQFILDRAFVTLPEVPLELAIKLCDDN